MPLGPCEGPRTDDRIQRAHQLDDVYGVRLIGKDRNRRTQRAMIHRQQCEKRLASRLTGEFRLRSGATSSEYFDKYWNSSISNLSQASLASDIALRESRVTDPARP